MTSDLNKCNVVDIASLRASIINQLHPVSVTDLTTIPSVPLDTVNDGQWSSSQMLGDTEIKEMPVCVSPEKSRIDCDVDVGGNTGDDGSHFVSTFSGSGAEFVEQCRPPADYLSDCSDSEAVQPCLESGERMTVDCCGNCDIGMTGTPASHDIGTFEGLASSGRESVDECEIHVNEGMEDCVNHFRCKSEDCVGKAVASTELFLCRTGSLIDLHSVRATGPPGVSDRYYGGSIDFCDDRVTGTTDVHEDQNGENIDFYKDRVTGTTDVHEDQNGGSIDFYKDRDAGTTDVHEDQNGGSMDFCNDHVGNAPDVCEDHKERIVDICSDLCLTTVGIYANHDGELTEDYSGGRGNFLTGNEAPKCEKIVDPDNNDLCRKGDEVLKITQYRAEDSSLDEESDNSSLSDFEVESDGDVVTGNPSHRNFSNVQFCDPHSRGYFKPCELPPIEDLTISLNDDTELFPLGVVTSIVGLLVVVESTAYDFYGPLNEDTVLFSEDRTPLGKIFDVFGTTKLPCYTMRFNDDQCIGSRGIRPGLIVYFVPAPSAHEELPLTHYVFVKQLTSEKWTCDGSSVSDDSDSVPAFSDPDDCSAPRGPPPPGMSKSCVGMPRRRRTSGGRKDGDRSWKRKASQNCNRQQNSATPGFGVSPVGADDAFRQTSKRLRASRNVRPSRDGRLSSHGGRSSQNWSSCHNGWPSRDGRLSSHGGRSSQNGLSSHSGWSSQNELSCHNEWPSRNVGTSHSGVSFAHSGVSFAHSGVSFAHSVTLAVPTFVSSQSAVISSGPAPSRNPLTFNVNPLWPGMKQSLDCLALQSTRHAGKAYGPQSSNPCFNTAGSRPGPSQGSFLFGKLPFPRGHSASSGSLIGRPAGFPYTRLPPSRASGSSDAKKILAGFGSYSSTAPLPLFPPPSCPISPSNCRLPPPLGFRPQRVNASAVPINQPASVSPANDGLN